MQPLKFPRSKKLLWPVIAGAFALSALVYYLLLPVAEVARVERGTAIAAVYGTVRIEPNLILPVHPQYSGFIRLTNTFADSSDANCTTL